MITCDQATKLISKQRDEALSLRERVQLRLHLLLCSWCTRYQKNLRLMSTAISAVFESNPGDQEGGEERAKRFAERVKSVLRSKTGGS